jgi:hypothetical protein
MVKALGRKTRMTFNVTDIQVSIITIRNTVMVNSIGSQGTFTRVTTQTMRGMDTGKCTSQMALSTKATGRVESKEEKVC